MMILTILPVLYPHGLFILQPEVYTSYSSLSFLPIPLPPLSLLSFYSFIHESVLFYLLIYVFF